jgi:hypothetical protein
VRKAATMFLRMGYCACHVGRCPDCSCRGLRMPGRVTKKRFEMLLGTKEHEMHHRAQLTVIERLLGGVPHLTRRRQVASEEAAS